MADIRDALVFPVKRGDHFMYPEAMFRTKTRPLHGGIDLTPIKANTPEPVYAVETGIIVISDRYAESTDQSGLDVMILGATTGIRWWYGHLSKVTVRLGDKVTKGTVIGATGTTGNSSGVHLHFEAHYPIINYEVNPWVYLRDVKDITGSTAPLAESRVKAVSQTSTAIPTIETSILRGEDDNMFVAKQNSTGHIYTIGKQFIRHEQKVANAQFVANVLTFEDRIIPMDDEQFLSILDALGIERTAAKSVLGGKSWSPYTGVIDTRD